MEIDKETILITQRTVLNVSPRKPPSLSYCVMAEFWTEIFNELLEIQVKISLKTV